MGTTMAPVEGSGSWPVWMHAVENPNLPVWRFVPPAGFFAIWYLLLISVIDVLLLESPAKNPYSPPSKIFFDRYRSAESGITVTTRFPFPSLPATWIAANTLAPALEPPRTPSNRASCATVSNASLSVTLMTSSHTAGSNVFGIKLEPIPSTLCGPLGPPPRTDPSVSTAAQYRSEER